MAGEYEKAITIEKAIKNIEERKYLLPAIQRKFEWDTDRICVLFDSIMRDYPINTFMFWSVTSSEVKKRFKFYQFLDRYCEVHSEDNPDFPLQGRESFYAVIDGQQRLTSIYIGLKGTYANKLPRRHHTTGYDEAIYPPKRLYLNLSGPLNEEDNESKMKYEFIFLTKEECESHPKSNYLFQIGDILDFPNEDSEILVYALDYLKKRDLTDERFALNTITRLYDKIRRKALIHYFNEENQEIDHVLDIFIRTNHGGKPLSFSDLLMSIAIANWQENAREQIDGLIKNVWQDSNMGFSISRDVVLKTALALTNADIRFKVGNFSGDIVKRIENEWDEIKKCIISSFRLIKNFGLNDYSFRAKNAVIPIAYYLYHKSRNFETKKSGIFVDINNLAKHHEEKILIKKWLMMSLLTGVFGGQSDSLLSGLLKIIKDNIQTGYFPLKQIVEAYRGHRKSIVFDEDIVDNLLNTKKDHPECFMILSLLMPERISTDLLHKDHLHPASLFSLDRISDYEFINENESIKKFYLNTENWDSIPNLHLLDRDMNQSKSDKSLLEWVKSIGNEDMVKKNLLVPHEASLKFEDFPDFINKRRKYLAKILLSMGHLN